jgi:uncharacterized protein (DUF342 family)
LLELKKKSLQAIYEKSRLYAKGYEFGVGEDKLEGVIRPMLMHPKPIELADIAEILKISGIKYGIVDPARLTATLAANATPKVPWIIAKGRSPVPDEKAQLVYHFETDPLRIGTLKETGFMDYKDRGKIPQVKAGTLVAEKILGKKGAPGIDIFGQPVNPPKAPVVRLRCGKGVASIGRRPEGHGQGKRPACEIRRRQGACVRGPQHRRRHWNPYRPCRL